MQVFRGLPPVADAPIALTIGNFDGVHRGHQAMLSRLVEAAEDLGLLPAVLSFDPHPLEFFVGAAAPPRLSTLRAKIEHFRAHGVARSYIVRFNACFADLTPEAFIERVLVQQLAVRWILVGEDFRFGKGRTGGLATLRQAARSFSVEVMHTVEVGGKRVSSSAVRAALAEGEFDHAAELLGRRYTISGRVAHGAKLGRSLGFPTANLPLRNKVPLKGIFAVKVHGLGDTARTGVASLGIRPTLIAGGPPLLEVFVFDFDEAIYGRRVSVEFMHKLRDEARYPDLPSLARQIETDVAQARGYFAALR